MIGLRIIEEHCTAIADFVVLDIDVCTNRLYVACDDCCCCEDDGWRRGEERRRFIVRLLSILDLMIVFEESVVG
jgi:hypothetical protein